MSKNVVHCWLLVASLIICSLQIHAQETYPTRDYITVGKMMDTVQTPYIINVAHGQKHVVFIGCQHTRDTLNNQFTIIQQQFNRLNPQLAFNEGGQVADSIHFSSLNSAAVQKGETGVLKYLSDSAGIQLLDGDISDSAEFAMMLPRYNRQQLLLYYLMERLVIPYLSGAYGNGSFEALYNKAISRWFIKPGFPVLPAEQTYAGFKTLYKKLTGHSFQLTMNPDIELFDYINPNCSFCAIGRASKMVRDSVLLSKIQQALVHNDRVIITFGHGHALALEPALKQMIKQY